MPPALERTSGPSALSIRDLSKSFGDRRALDGVSLELSAGEVLGLLGPNGAGKTTVVRSVAGRAEPDGGRVSILGFSPSDDGARSARGWVPQEIALYPLLSPRENLWTFGRYQGLAGGGPPDRHPRQPVVDRPLRPRQRQDRPPVRRNEASPQHRRRHDPRAPRAPARRADRGRGPAVARAHLRHDRRAQVARRGPPLHDPLHGGGRAPLRPHRDHRPRKDHRGGNQGRARATNARRGAGSRRSTRPLRSRRRSRPSSSPGRRAWKANASCSR